MKNIISKRQPNTPAVNSHSHRDRVNRVKKGIVFGLIVLSMLLMAAWSLPDRGGNYAKKPTHTPAVTTVPGQPTPYPEEFLKNQEQTNEIVLVGVFLVLIVVGGTFSIISRKN